MPAHNPLDAREPQPKPKFEDEPGRGIANCFRAIEDAPVDEPAKAKPPAEEQANEDG